MKAPRLLVADGHLGIWSALAQVYPETEEQRCWNHKFVNVLDQVPLKKQGPLKQWLRKMMYADTRAECEAAVTAASSSTESSIRRRWRPSSATGSGW